MLFWLTIFVLALPIRASIAPVIGLGINSDKLGTFDAIEPTLEWAGAATVGESVDLQGGALVTVRNVDKPSDIPIKLWARATTNYGGLAWAARADCSSQEFAVVDWDLQAQRKNTNLRLWAAVNLERLRGKLQAIQLTQTLSALKLMPSYNFQSQKPNLRAILALGDSRVSVNAQQRQLALSYPLGSRQTIHPSFSLIGNKFALTHEQRLDYGGKLLSTYRPNDGIEVAWASGAWQASMGVPMDGFYQVRPDQVYFSMRHQLDTAGVL